MNLHLKALWPNDYNALSNGTKEGVLKICNKEGNPWFAL